MFTVLCGCDGSGKSTLCKELAKATNSFYTREPTFTSEQADSLNLGSKNDIQREIEFAVDRVKHTYEILKPKLAAKESVICDRYIWSGLAYCNVYNPSAFVFAEALYNHEFFIKPDFYVFVDTPVDICFERRHVQPIEHLIKIRNAYLDTQHIVEKHSKVITIQGVGAIEGCIENLKSKLI
jgi:thymidylate kinase